MNRRDFIGTAAAVPAAAVLSAKIFNPNSSSFVKFEKKSKSLKNCGLRRGEINVWPPVWPPI